ncbi:hypothetical protein ACEV99_22725, partial [Vibrio parahaemolyticus]
VSTGLASKVKSFCVYWSLFLALHLTKCAFQVRSGGTRCEVFALSLSFTVPNFQAISLVWFLWRWKFSAKISFFEAVVEVRSTYPLLI